MAKLPQRVPDRDWQSLADAFGVPLSISGISAAIYERLRGPAYVAISKDNVADLPVEFGAIQQLLLLLDRPDLARMRRGLRPSRQSWKKLTTMVSTYPIPTPVEAFIDEVIAEIASAISATT